MPRFYSIAPLEVTAVFGRRLLSVNIGIRNVALSSLLREYAKSTRLRRLAATADEPMICDEKRQRRKSEANRFARFANPQQLRI
jgi:hypothetical protein